MYELIGVDGMLPIQWPSCWKLRWLSQWRTQVPGAGGMGARQRLVETNGGHLGCVVMVGACQVDEDKLFDAPRLAVECRYGLKLGVK